MPPSTCQVFFSEHSWPQPKGTCERKGGGCLLENRKICRLPSSASGFPAGSDSRETPCSAGDPGSISGLERSPGEGNAYPLQYSCLGNPVDRGAWWGHKESDTTEWLNTSTFTAQSHCPASTGRAPSSSNGCALSLNTERGHMQRPPSLSSS